jgi:hypothetical protein
MTDEIIELDEEEKTFTTKWQIPEGIVTPFVTNMVVQRMENVFKIMFFEAKPPIRLDKSDPMPEKIPADYVAGIIVTPEKLSTFVEILKRQIDKIKAKKE